MERILSTDLGFEIRGGRFDADLGRPGRPFRIWQKLVSWRGRVVTFDAPWLEVINHRYPNTLRAARPPDEAETRCALLQERRPSQPTGEVTGVARTHAWLGRVSCATCPALQIKFDSSHRYRCARRATLESCRAGAQKSESPVCARIMISAGESLRARQGCGGKGSHGQTTIHYHLLKQWIQRTSFWTTTLVRARWWVRQIRNPPP
jgi:hypothetical protein